MHKIFSFLTLLLATMLGAADHEGAAEKEEKVRPQALLALSNEEIERSFVGMNPNMIGAMQLSYKEKCLIGCAEVVQHLMHHREALLGTDCPAQQVSHGYLVCDEKQKTKHVLTQKARTVLPQEIQKLNKDIADAEILMQYFSKRPLRAVGFNNLKEVSQ